MGPEVFRLKMSFLKIGQVLEICKLGLILISLGIIVFVVEKRTQNRNTAQHHTLVANHAHEHDQDAIILAICYVIQVHVHRVRLQKK